QPRSAPGDLYLPQGEDGFPEVTNIVESNPGPRVALEGLPGLPGTPPPAKHLHDREPFDLGVVLVNPRLEVVAVPGFHAPFEDLHVLLRHRLLTQPGGFESFGAMCVLLYAENLAVAQRVDLRF